jgi:DNA repair exonuclease SbcCD ATPase subunit
LIEIIQQLTTLKANSDVQKKEATKIAALHKELADDESSRKEAISDIQVCTKVAQELKAMLDQILAQVTPLETHIGVLSNTITDTASELRAKALGLE